MYALRQRRTWLVAAWMILVAWLGTGVALRAAADAPFREGNWPFHPPRRPAVPCVQAADWPRNPIDAFVLAALEAEGLAPSPPADRLTLLRRVTFDLTGLAPTLAEQQAFLADTASDAYPRLVERLLESPRYGERWAQHWLDLVRYAETDGFKSDEHRPDAYRYRDYVIRAFNADLPYDRFIRQQLAGDEIEPDNPEALIATGLNRLYPDESNAADVRQRRQQIHDELTETTALVFLGLTVGCAQCHDHKFDPISQVDYFRFQAFFATLLPSDDLPLGTTAELARYRSSRQAWEDATRAIRAELESLMAPHRQATFDGALEKFRADIRDALNRPDAERTCLERQLAFQAMRYVQPKMAGVSAKSLSAPQQARYETLTRQLATYDSLKPAALPTAMGVTDGSGAAPSTYRLALGDYRKPLEEVQPGFPAFLGASEPQWAAAGADRSPGRRAALADWLCRGDHPLTARVMMNRVWQHHFGAGIVSTPNDFGAMGDPPTHPALLDWLAVEFVARGWSLKAVHRLMVNSAAYQQASRVDFDRPEHARGLERDASNRLLWHARRSRLDGETLRDAMLELSGELEDRMFGPSARPELPAGIEGSMAWKPDPRPSQRNRRSIYVLAKRNLRYPLFDVFDQPDLHNSCPQRTATTTAPQALALLNGEFSLAQARKWGGRLLREHGDDTAALVRRALCEAFAQSPADDDVRAGEAFIRAQADAVGAGGTQPQFLPEPLPTGIAASRGAAVVDFCHALFNANEFVYVD